MYKRGSSLIMVLLSMMLIFTLGLSLLALVGNDMVSTRLQMDSASAYYAAESGMSRASSVIKNDTRKIIMDVIRAAQDSYNYNALANVASPDELYDSIINKINAEFLVYTNPFKEGSFYKRLSLYQGEGGIDGKELSLRTAPYKSYYTLNVTVSPFDWANKTQRIVNIISTGHSRNSTRIITCNYTLYYPISIMTVPPLYTYLNPFMSRSLSVLGDGRQVFDSCTVACSGDMLLESKSISLKNCSMNTYGKAMMKGSLVSLYNNVKITGTGVFDYDCITCGPETQINGSTNCIIPDSLIEGEIAIPPQLSCDTTCDIIVACISRAGTSESAINYLYYDKNAVIDNEIFDAGPDDVYVIISRDDLTIMDKGGSPISFKGSVYCGGRLCIYCDDFDLSGFIVCRNADFKGRVKIENGILTPEQLDEIASVIRDSLSPGSISVLEDYDFICEGWQE